MIAASDLDDGASIATHEDDRREPCRSTRPSPRPRPPPRVPPASASGQPTTTLATGPRAAPAGRPRSPSVRATAAGTATSPRRPLAAAQRRVGATCPRPRRLTSPIRMRSNRRDGTELGSLFIVTDGVFGFFSHLPSFI
ncbi:hypothetical protein MAPG_05462 [Magnaporthiopsis poae ATCC 64411]|uniref:Uncharacterized protein n=1 Tax=Magnaporthiopsis poae (strain ATCC 64411 / 73-15) TaxID=644358 RepID=A0A0C4DZG2_MAGP6|nr:hypothetical protein MAPG_05462 [Magnaporthiopsis poae ATCC 64411]